MQVISNPNDPALSETDPATAVALAQQTNNRLVNDMRQYPGRFAALATLPLVDPEAAAVELQRAVTENDLKGALIAGVPFGHFLDEPQYLPIFAMAEKLDVPIYLHPGMPSKAERDMLYRSPAYSDAIGDMLGSAGWGWHAEQGIQMMRLIMSGLFDKYPKLKLISGHWGEMVPNFLERLDEFTGMVPNMLERKFSDYYRQNVYITASGMFTKPQMNLGLAEMGASHVLWAEDYPYLLRKAQVADFLNNADISAQDRELMAHVNSEQLFKLN